MIMSVNRKPWKILIVDDNKDIHDVTVLTLKRLIFDERTLEFIHAFSAKEAIQRLTEHSDIAIALVDVVMETDSAGLDLVKAIRDELRNETIRIILRTGYPGLAPEESVTLNYDINDYRSKTELSAQSLKTVIITALRSYKSLITIQNLKNEIHDTQRELIYSLSEIAESRVTDIGKHVERVGAVSAFIASKMGYDDAEVDCIHLAASMHDIGKMAIHDSILNKPGRLTDEEFEEMMKHCEYGYEILRYSNRKLFRTAAIIAYEHHENFNGSGYPRGLKEDEINLISRIVALVDVFDALATKRVYKDVWPQDKILNYIRSQIGIKFDPNISAIFFENLDEINEIIEKIQAQ